MKKIAIVLFVVSAALVGCGKKKPAAAPAETTAPAGDGSAAPAEGAGSAEAGSAAPAEGGGGM